MIRILSFVLLAAAFSHTGAMAQARGLAPITDAQQAKIQAALELKTGNKALGQAVSESAPTIDAFLKIHSCMTGYDASGLNLYAAPGKTYPNNNYSKGPMPTMYRHNKASCVTVQRVHGWKMPTPNTLSFEVVYQSEGSGESGKSGHEMQKQPGGEWLFSR